MARHALVALFAVLVLVTFVSQPLVAQSKGTFQAGIDYPAGPATVFSNTGSLFGGISPLEVHTRDSKGNPLDFNGDGKPDVVVAASCSAPTLPSGSGSAGIPGCPASGYAVVVYLGNGDGTFQPPIISGGPAPALRSIVVGDFNGDGKPDVAVASDCLNSQDCSAGTITILLGNGDGTFSVGQTYAFNGVAVGPNTITAGDLNGDGKQDVVVTLGCDFSNGGCAQGAVKVYLGNGDGTFQAPSSYATGGNSAIPVVLGDFNKDGKPDVLVTVAGPTLVFFPGNGDGTLGTPSSTSFPPPFFYGAQAITTADFNGDGNLDVAVFASSYAEVAIGNGDGTFQTPIAYGAFSAGGVYVSSMVAADMNGDGKPDLIVGSGNGINYAALLLNDGLGNFTNSSTFYLGGTEAAFVDVADFNGDGKNDIVLASNLAETGGADDGTLSVLLGNGDGTMRSATYVSEGRDIFGRYPAGPAVAAADINGDGFQDLLYPSGCVAGEPCSQSGFTLLLSDGAGGYQAPLQFTAPGQQSQFLAIGDFNGDGKPDVAVFNGCDASCTATSVSIFLNTGNGTFANPVVYETGGSPYSTLTMATGDFNGDGKGDIAVLQSDSSPQSTIGVLLGNGDGTFQPVVTTPLGSSGGTWIASADFNGDGKTDLVLAENNRAQILLSNGDATFSFGAVYDGGGGPGTVVTGDVNGDGKADVVIGNQCELGDCANGSIGILLGNGDGTFQYAANSPQSTTDGNLVGIALADVNADGKLDVIASTYTGILVSFGKGNGTLQSPTVYAALTASPRVQLAVADLNGDGGLDIVQPGSNGQLAILYNQVADNRVPPTVAIHASPSQTIYGQQLTLQGQITSTAEAAPTGTVLFLDGSNGIGYSSVVNGIATLTTSGLPAGTHSLIARYSGDTQTGTGSSQPLSLTVSQATSMTSVSSSLNPDPAGQALTFTATITPQYGGTATGTATFLDGPTTLGTASLSGNSAALTGIVLTAGTHSITASYSGDNNVQGSFSTVLSQSVGMATTTTALTSSVNPSLLNQSVTFTATVAGQSGGTPTGTVTFKQGTLKVGTFPLSNAQASYTTTYTTIGTRSITAIYSGDANFTGSTSAALKQVVERVSTTIAVASSENPSNFGDSVTFTATVTPSNTTLGLPVPSGSVTFKDGTTTLGTGTINGGTATLAISSLVAGSHKITAHYAGDIDYLASTSTTLVQVVDGLPTTTSINVDVNPSAFGQTVTFTATVAPNSGTATPTGTLTFKSGTATLAKVPLSGGTASYSSSVLAVGTKTITAVYSGDTTYAASTSSALSQVITKASTTTALTSSPNPSAAGQSVTFTATVSPQYSGTPTGSVSFRLGTKSLQTVTLSGGSASYTTTTLAIGSDTITATYNGSADFGVSSGSIVQSVAPLMISNFSMSNVTQNDAVVTWTTNKPSTSQGAIALYPPGNYTLTSVDTTLVTNHTVTFTGLTNNTIYSVYVISTDTLPNNATETATSAVTNFRTLR